MLSGRVHGEVPFDIEGRPARVVLRVLWFLANHVLTITTPLGPQDAARGPRRAAARCCASSATDLAAAGVERTDARVAGVRDGRPVLEDGRVLDVANVVWCTGFGKDSRLDRRSR